jgi:hypothetical protein
VFLRVTFRKLLTQDTVSTKDFAMPENASTWAIGSGSVVVAFSLFLLAATMADTTDQHLLPVGACIFSLGILMIASGFYLKARALKAQFSGLPPAPRAQSGGCEKCQAETPVIHCRVHHLHLCGHCLAEHYDFRSCAYVPSTRRQTAKNNRSMAAKAR